ncbi:MAG: pilin protein [Selenomonadaceae bacterium]|nr:pilin protein [Selenomonadaceae bacterium]MBR0102757.1 pilin protein [Selenomonadaceae bacterium]
MLKKIRELIKKGLQKGQGVVEYALMLGFVAIIAAYLIGGSNLVSSVKGAIDDVKGQIDSSRLND